MSDSAAPKVQWSDFEKLQIRVGTIVAVEDFPEARKPAYRLAIDFGEFGLKRSSAQITDLYSKEELVGTQVLAVLAFPPKRIAGFMSEVLVTGAADSEGRVVLMRPDHPVPNGTALF